MRIDPEFGSPFAKDTMSPTKELELRALAREFEAILTAQILESLSTSLSGSQSKQDPAHTLDGLIWLELAQQLTSQRDLGLASSLYEQLANEHVSTLGPSPTLPAAPRHYVLSGNTSPRTERTDPASTRPTDETDPISPTWMLRPVTGRLSSPYGKRLDPFDGDSRSHHGIDWAAPEGSPVLAAQRGRVVASEQRRGYGNTVVVRHPNGVETLYAHLSRLDVAPGETVERGQALGAVGQTGRATGAHLHFEVRRDGQAENPESWFIATKA